MIQLTLPLPPSANRYWRHVPGKGTMLSAEARRYRKEAQMLASVAMRHRAPLTGRIAVRLDVYRDLRGDLANHEKQLLDALEGIVFADDKQAWYLEMARHVDRHRPRVEVTVQKIAEEPDLRVPTPFD